MDDVDITDISSYGTKLYNDVAQHSPAISSLEVYSRGWIKQQRVALKRRLGAETGRQQRRDVSNATKFVSA